jgi:neuronal calcium sensor 1
MTKDGFKKFAALAMPEAPQDADVEYLFRAMVSKQMKILTLIKDQNKDGTITFKEFLIFQSITAPSRKSFDPEELINMAFAMYDEVCFLK